MNNTIEKIVESVLIQNRIGNYTKRIWNYNYKYILAIQVFNQLQTL